MNNNINSLSYMTETELMEVNGGWIRAALIIAGCVILVCWGAYNGYKDTASGK